MHWCVDSRPASGELLHRAAVVEGEFGLCYRDVCETQWQGHHHKLCVRRNTWLFQMMQPALPLFFGQLHSALAILQTYLLKSSMCKKGVATSSAIWKSKWDFKSLTTHIRFVVNHPSTIYCLNWLNYYYIILWTPYPGVPGDITLMEVSSEGLFLKFDKSLWRRTESRSLRPAMAYVRSFTV